MYFEKRLLLGITIYDTRMPDLLEVVTDILDNQKTKIIFGVSAAAFGRLRARPDLYGIYQKMDILVAEGAGLPILAKFFGIQILEKIGMVNLVFELLQLANERKYKVLFFGSTESTNQLVINQVKTKYPNVNIAKGINGYFNEENLPKIIQEINAERPDILFIGISYPIKERFAVKYKNILNAHLIIPCGGAFDVIAGKAKRAPTISNKVPIAWLFRFIQEPVRLFKPIILPTLYTVFVLLPKLLFVHYCVRPNPSIKDILGIDEAEWNPETDPVKPQ